MVLILSNMHARTHTLIWSNAMAYLSCLYTLPNCPCGVARGPFFIPIRENAHLPGRRRRPCACFHECFSDSPQTKHFQVPVTSSSAFLFSFSRVWSCSPWTPPQVRCPLCVLEPHSEGTGACIRAQWLGGKASKCKCLYTDPLLSRYLGVLNSCGPSGQFMTVLWDCAQI